MRMYHNASALDLRLCNWHLLKKVRKIETKELCCSFKTDIQIMQSFYKAIIYQHLAPPKKETLMVAAVASYVTQCFSDFIPYK